MINYSRKVGIACRVSTLDQATVLAAYEESCQEFCEVNRFKPIHTIKIVANVWADEWKDPLRELARVVLEDGGDAIVFPTTLRAAKAENWTTENPHPRLTQNDLEDLKELILGLEPIFVVDESFEAEHSYQTKITGRAGRPIKKTTAKVAAKRLRNLGFSYGKIQSELSSKGFKISRMGICKWFTK